mmetsp:Transcript_35208/g.36620  ORF Transcript_35208/g.36620 Transcript_35208/m.36620 type:complete len:159 (-) Transcript_35208:9-485(-)
MSSDDCNSHACIDKPSISEFKVKANSNYLGKELQLEKYYPERPFYRTEIGRITWRVFHRFSSVYSNTEKDKEEFNNFVEGVKMFFPCPTCREDFQQELIKLPLSKAFDSVNEDKYKDSFNNGSLISWVCQQHNTVNTKIGKKAVNCEDFPIIRAEYNF